MSNNNSAKKKAKKLAKEAEKAALIKKQNIITWSIVGAVTVALVFLILALCGVFSSHEISDGDYVPPITKTDENTVFVKMTIKNYGDIVLLLDGTSAPATVANFVKLVNEGFYDGLTFHRVMKDFMIQGGDPRADGTGGSSEKIVGEFSANGYNNPIQHERGIISMARSSYNSASSQFFICNSDSASVQALDGLYAAFGCVVKGIGIVDKITEDTVRYADAASSYTIKDKTKQAVIEKAVVLENYEYNP